MTRLARAGKCGSFDRQRIRAGNRSRPQLLFAQQTGKRDGSKAGATDTQ